MTASREDYMTPCDVGECDECDDARRRALDAVNAPVPVSRPWWTRAVILLGWFALGYWWLG